MLLESAFHWLFCLKFSLKLITFYAPHFTLVKEALIEIGSVVTSLVVGCHARALWPNGAS